MIRHTVVFTLSHAKGSPGETTFLKALAVLSAIPGVRNFEVLQQISPKNDYDYGLSMEFESFSQYDAYNTHPSHSTFVRNHWLPSVEKFMELDFEPVR